MALLEYGYDRKQLKNQILWFGAWVCVTGIGAWLTPDKSGHGTHQQLGLPPCPSVLLFDRPCPGCGLTTSWTAFIHGHFAEAFHAHPLGPIMYVFYTFTALVAGYGYVKSARFATDSKSFTRFTNVTLALFIAFGAVRMAITPHFGTDSEHILAIFSRKT